MLKRMLWSVSVAAILAMPAAPVFAADAVSCTVPGITVVTDPAGDELGAPIAGFADILSLSLAEPASTDGTDRLVFTYKVSDLATKPPDTLWIVRFVTDVPPTDGHDEYWVAMLTGPDAAAHFVYGTDGRVDGSGGSGPGLFTPTGTLDSQSHFNPDGTITLVLDKSKIPGLNAGEGLSGTIVLTHRITPTDGTKPFMYGFRSVSTTSLAWDDTSAPDDYIFVGNESCVGKSGSDIFAAGSLAPLPLLALLLGALTRRRRSLRTR